MLLCRRQDEYHVCRRFLKSLQKGVECRCRQHVHLVDDKHLILTHLRRYSCLFHQSLDVLHRVIAGSVEFKDVIRALFVERLAAFAFVAGLTFSSRVLAVDGLGKDTCACSLAHAPWSAEQVGMSQLPALHRVFQRSGKSRLSHNRVEGHRSVFARRNNIFFHNTKKSKRR